LVVWTLALFVNEQPDSKMLIALSAGICAIWSSLQTFTSILRILLPAIFLFSFLSYIVQLAIISVENPNLGFVAIAVSALWSTLEPLSIGIALASISLLVSCMEWRGSALKTVNGMGLPRDLRIIGALVGSLVGDFSKAIQKVHFSTTARGQTAPRFAFRNFLSLPFLVRRIWIIVFGVAASRLTLQWSSDQFWERYIPKAPMASLRRPEVDWVVLVIGILLLVSGLIKRGM
jgi:hypothetical protein